MWFIFLILVVVVVFVIVKKSSDKDKVNSGNYNEVINLIKYYYEQARVNHEALGVDVISISTYWFEMDGRIDSSSSFMSVCLRDGINDELAESIGMQVNSICGKKYYQYVIKGKFSKTTKCEIIKNVVKDLSVDYPNDHIKFDEKIPALFAMVDCKDFMDKLGR